MSEAKDLAGQGEPVAWAYEWKIYTGWRRGVEFEKPCAGQFLGLRNVRALGYLDAAPAPSRPADRAGLAQSHYELLRECQAEFKALGCKGLVETIEAQCQRHLALCDAPRDGGDGKSVLSEIKSLLRSRMDDPLWLLEHQVEVAEIIAIFDRAPRDGRDGWSDDMEAAPKDGSLILLYGKMRRSPYAGWYIGKWWKHPDESFWVAHSVEIAATRWAPLPPSPNAGDRMKASAEWTPT